ncbi:MAG: hypothetical protein K2K44_03770, partial [Oscillospiraceae bacterium]|nr:hypothetical protein [Oscillospiraceae bacterium]
PLWCLTPEFVNIEQIPNPASKIQRQANRTDKASYNDKYKFMQIYFKHHNAYILFLQILR